MAYATTNPPAMISQRVAGSGALWHYNTTDASTVVDGDGYITNAEDLGMKVGDFVLVSDLAGGTVGYMVMVSAINANGSADLSNLITAALTNVD